jgi:hypothetical protein
MHYRIHTQRARTKLASFSQKTELGRPYLRPGESAEALNCHAALYRREFPPVDPESEALANAISYISFRRDRYIADEQILSAVKHPALEVQVALDTVRGLIANLEEISRWILASLRFYGRMHHLDAREAKAFKGQPPNADSLAAAYTERIPIPDDPAFPSEEV